MIHQVARLAAEQPSRCRRIVLRSRSVQQRATDPFPYDSLVAATRRADLAGLPDELAPEPAQLTGASIGYARVSTVGQILDRQTRALTDAGCIRVFADKQSGKTADRPELAACLDYLRPGDSRRPQPRPALPLPSKT